MTPEQWNEWINLGLPTASLIAMVYAGYKAVRWTTAKVIEPLLGDEGAVHRYFTEQNKQTERLGDIADRHQKLTEELTKTCGTHHKISESHFEKSESDMVSLIVIHSHIVRAMAAEATSDEAKAELVKADQIIQRLIA